MSAEATTGRIAEIFFFDPGRGRDGGPPGGLRSPAGLHGRVRLVRHEVLLGSAGGRAVDLAGVMRRRSLYPCRRAVITGGEPLESPLFYSARSRALKTRDL